MEKQTQIELIRPHICKLCGEDYSIYEYSPESRLCMDCGFGINIGQWVWDKIAENY